MSRKMPTGFEHLPYEQENLGETVRSIFDLRRAAQNRKSVVCPHVRWQLKPCPAAWVLNYTGSMLCRLISSGMFVYKTKEEVEKPVECPECKKDKRKIDSLAQFVRVQEIIARRDQLIGSYQSASDIDCDFQIDQAQSLSNLENEIVELRDANDILQKRIQVLNESKDKLHETIASEHRVVEQLRQRNDNDNDILCTSEKYREKTIQKLRARIIELQTTIMELKRADARFPVTRDDNMMMKQAEEIESLNKKIDRLSRMNLNLRGIAEESKKAIEAIKEELSTPVGQVMTATERVIREIADNSLQTNRELKKAFETERMKEEE